VLPRITPSFVLFSAFSLLGLAACSSFYTDQCDDVYHPNYKLADCQKSTKIFKKGKTTHYEHSNGFEFDLTVSQDSTFTDNWSDFCVVAKEEDRTVILTSTYPIMSVEVNFYGGINVSEEENKQNLVISHFMPMHISHGNTGFFVELDSTGTPQEKGIDGTVRMLDTITFNGVTYDSVFAIMDMAHYNALNYHEQIESDTAFLYFSKTAGILKLETTDGKSFTIKEGGDDE
jgi:formylmethanofuran dehydrogenase subunit D